MAEYQAIYKCRLCGKEFKSAVTTDTNIVIKHMLSVTIAYKSAEYIGAPVTELSMHSCKDGSMGLADFLGFKKVDDKNESD